MSYLELRILQESYKVAHSNKCFMLAKLLDKRIKSLIKGDEPNETLDNIDFQQEMDAELDKTITAQERETMSTEGVF